MTTVLARPSTTLPNNALDAGERRPAVLPIVLYNDEARWRAAVAVGELIVPVGSELAPYQPSQRYHVVDERHTGAEDLPASNLTAAVLGLEQNRTPGDVVRVAGLLVEWMHDPRDDGLKRAFADWARQMAEGFVPGDAALPAVRTLEGVRMNTLTLITQLVQFAAPFSTHSITRASKSPSSPEGRMRMKRPCLAVL